MLAELLHLHLSVHSHRPFRITKGQVRTLTAESCPLCRGYFCLFVLFWVFFVCLFLVVGIGASLLRVEKSTGANSAGQEISDNVLPHGGVC